MNSQPTMHAMVLHEIGQALTLDERAIPQPGPGEVLLRVEACAVCRTDLHIVDGELPVPHLPIIPGHEIVGKVMQIGSEVNSESCVHQGLAFFSALPIESLALDGGEC